MRLAPSGRAIVGFREKQWVEDRVTNGWEDLEIEQAHAETDSHKSGAAGPVERTRFFPGGQHAVSTFGAGEKAGELVWARASARAS